jgi:putative exporter of polyketide antibiotics
MDPTRIVLSGLWIATMLTYLLGDVLRIFAGDMEPGKLAGGMQASQAMWILVAVIMLLPIVMLVLSLTLRYPAIRWLNIVAPVLVVLFNIAGLPYKGAYDNFLIAVSFVFNALTVWYAWKWVV